MFQGCSTDVITKFHISLMSVAITFPILQTIKEAGRSSQLRFQYMNKELLW